MRLRRLACAAAIAAALAAPTAFAQQDRTDPKDLAIEGLDKIMSALELLLMAIPTYELPEVLPNGDIIIRRSRPTPEREAPESETVPEGEVDKI